ncbi:MAG: hypothetical protein K0Q90_775 [Paenibacillaceae bacterium]|nr:hypothetical protein [Paenibacillaceae bacterium]
MTETRKSDRLRILALAGSLILAGMLGLVLHSPEGLLLPLAAAALGYYAIARKWTAAGTILLFAGGIGLLSQFGGTIAIVAAAGAIAYGLSLLRNKNPLELEA